MRKREKKSNVERRAEERRGDKRRGESERREEERGSSRGGEERRGEGRKGNEAGKSDAEWKGGREGEEQCGEEGGPVAGGSALLLVEATSAHHLPPRLPPHPHSWLAARKQ